VRDSDTPATKRIARTKAPLFYVALEDAYGKDQIRAGLRQMVTLMRGKEAGIDVMRSALEQSTGKDLAPIFRIWLYQKGVPPDFRARYGPSSAQP
jgi:aminopeptidase N